MEKKVDGIFARILRTVFSKSWEQHLTKQQLYCHFLPVLQTVLLRQTRHAEHSWGIKDERISDVLKFTPAYGCASVDCPSATYIHQFGAETEFCLEDLQEVMDKMN